MPLTRDFAETVLARAERDPAFRAGLYVEAQQALRDGERGVAEILLRNYADANACLARRDDLPGEEVRSW